MQPINIFIFLLIIILILIVCSIIITSINIITASEKNTKGGNYYKGGRLLLTHIDDSVTTYITSASNANATSILSIDNIKTGFYNRLVKNELNFDISELNAIFTDKENADKETLKSKIYEYLKEKNPDVNFDTLEDIDDYADAIAIDANRLNNRYKQNLNNIYLELNSLDPDIDHIHHHSPITGSLRGLSKLPNIPNIPMRMSSVQLDNYNPLSTPSTNPANTPSTKPATKPAKQTGWSSYFNPFYSSSK